MAAAYAGRRTHAGAFLLVALTSSDGKLTAVPSSEQSSKDKALRANGGLVFRALVHDFLMAFPSYFNKLYFLEIPCPYLFTGCEYLELTSNIVKTNMGR